jgi:hypothetical protein
MSLFLPARIGWVNINPLQQKNPRGVGQRVGRQLEIHVPMAEVRCENLYNAVKSQTVNAGISVSNFGLPENGKPNRMAWVSGADLAIL